MPAALSGTFEDSNLRLSSSCVSRTGSVRAMVDVMIVYAGDNPRADLTKSFQVTG